MSTPSSIRTGRALDEFLPGPHLGNNLLNLGITEPACEALREPGCDLDELLAQEEESALGKSIRHYCGGVWKAQPAALPE